MLKQFVVVIPNVLTIVNKIFSVMSAGKNGGNYVSGSDMLTNEVDLVNQISVILKIFCNRIELFSS